MLCFLCSTPRSLPLKKIHWTEYFSTIKWFLFIKQNDWYTFILFAVRDLPKTTLNQNSVFTWEFTETYSSSFTSPKHYKRNYSASYEFLHHCVNISFTFTAVWKTNLQRVTDLPFHLCETTHGFETKQHTGFLHSLLLLLYCCAFFFFLHHKDKFTLLRFIHFKHCITILGFHWLLRSPVSLLTVCKKLHSHLHLQNGQHSTQNGFTCYVKTKLTRPLVNNKKY